MEIGFLEVGFGALGVIVLNNFVGWFMWRKFDKHFGRHVDKLDLDIDRLKFKVFGNEVFKD